MRKKITFLSVLLVAALLLGMVPFGAFRTEAYAATDEPVENENPMDVEGDKTASPTKLDPENLETTVTLQLPAGEYQNKVDIVFVMDNSTSVLDKGFDFALRAKNLLDNIVEHNQGIDLKVSVIKFRGYATDMLKTESNSGGLLDYEENANAISAAIANVNVPGSGSNMHSGLVMAEKFLSKDTEVDNDNKFVILLTDGKSYIWNNENDEPVMNYSQWFKNAGLQNNGRPYYNQSCGLYNKENKLADYHGLPYEGEVFSNFISYDVSNLGENAYSSDYYGNLFSSTSEKLTGKTDYDVPAYYSKYYKDKDATALGDVETISNISNASEVFNNTYKLYRNFYQYTPTEGTEWENLKYYSINPYKLKKAEDGTWMFDVDNPDEDFYLLHPTTMEKGTYVAGHYWKETIAKKYNTATILVDPHKYSYDANKQKWSTFSQGMFLAGSFDYWLKENSDVSAFITDNGTNNMIEGGEVSEDKVGELFTEIDNSIRYMVSEGVVTDQITDEFTLKNADTENGFRMTLNGKALAVTYADGKWNFGEIGNDGKYLYVVSYDESKKTITWEINVPVENLKPVTLSYDLIIAEDAANSEHNTNVSAVLNYVSSDGKHEGEYTFPIPTVEYESMAPYVIRHLDEETNNPIDREVNGSAKIGTYVSGSAVTVTGYEFSKVEPEEGGITITKVAADNVITFFYKVVEGNYLILHIDQDSDEVIREGSGKGQVGKYVTGAAITLDGYLVDLKDERTVSYLETLDEDESKNVMKFYYAPIYYELTYYSNYPNGESPKSATYSYRLKELPPEVKSPDDVEDPENGVFSVGKKWTSADGTVYDFTGWNTKPDGTGTSYQSPEKYQFDLNEEENPTNNNDNTDNNNQQGDAAGNATVTTSSLRTGLVMAASSSSIGATGALYGQWKPVPTPPGGNGSGSPTKYTVTYKYTGDVPSGAPAVPATKTYEAGDSVPAASEPSMEGYTFSGWSGEVSTMPKHDVTVTGSWTADEPIDDPDTPLAPPTDDETDIDDPDTPLAPGTIDEETEIDDEETPLSPFTGDNRHTGLWAGISIASLAGIALLSKRRRKPAKH